MYTFRNKKTGAIIHSDDPQDGNIWEWYPEACSVGDNDKSALSSQVGGSHYKNFAIQPVEFIHKNGIGFIEGCAIKYLCRWRQKNGVEDLKKAKHFIDMLIEMEEKK